MADLTYHQVDRYGYATFETLTIDAGASVGPGWILTEEAPPAPDEALPYVRFDGEGWALTEEPPPAPTVAELRAARSAALQGRINAIRDDRIDGGFEHEVGGETYTFQSRPSDRENILGLMMAAAASAAEPGDLTWFDGATPFGFITADNTVVPMDKVAVQALGARGMGFKAGQTFFARAFKDLVIAAEAAENDALLDDIEAALETGVVGPLPGWPA